MTRIYDKFRRAVPWSEETRRGDRGSRRESSLEGSTGGKRLCQVRCITHTRDNGILEYMELLCPASMTLNPPLASKRRWFRRGDTKTDDRRDEALDVMTRLTNQAILHDENDPDDGLLRHLDSW